MAAAKKTAKKAAKKTAKRAPAKKAAKRPAKKAAKKRSVLRRRRRRRPRRSRPRRPRRSGPPRRPLRSVLRRRPLRSVLRRRPRRSGPPRRPLRSVLKKTLLREEAEPPQEGAKLRSAGPSGRPPLSGAAPEHEAHPTQPSVKPAERITGTVAGCASSTSIPSPPCRPERSGARRGFRRLDRCGEGGTGAVDTCSSATRRR
jgi:hypothetical protein